MIVSILIPCFNEEMTILRLLDALLEQTFPLDQLEVIIADGMSTDQTRQKIKSFVDEHPEMRIMVIDNLPKTIPSAINSAARASSGTYLLRMDAHAFPASDYVEKCIHDLQSGVGDNVGGVCVMIPGDDTWIGRSIAEAVGHPLGVGDALYRFSRDSAYVDTVAFGAFRRDLFFEIGGFNEALLSNEDYEFNTRLREWGYKVFLDASIKVEYAARPTLKSLAKQYFRYGFWKYRMLIKNLSSIRIRQALPPLFVILIIGLFFFSMFLSAARLALIIVLGIYFSILILGSTLHSIKKNDIAIIVGMPIAIAFMHFSWGCGFLVSMLRSFLVK